MIRPKRHRRRTGLGLVEVIVALAISAALLTATGVALNASVKAHQVNQQQAQLLQSSRLALNRILTLIRAAKLHSPIDPALTAQYATGHPVTGTGIEIIDARNVDCIYKYDPANKQIIAIVNGTPHALLEGVTQFDVTMEPMRSAESTRTGGSWDLLRRATLTIKVGTSSKSMMDSEQANPMELTLSASTMPRRNAF